MSNNNRKQIFISYSWKDKDLVDDIDNIFKSYGITLIRDIRDLADRSNIKQFMKRVRTADHVLMIISNSYLRSKNCMYEVLEFLNSEEKNNRVLPFLLNDVRISSIEGKKAIIDYWKDLFQLNRTSASSSFDPTMKQESIREELLHYEKIYRTLDDFFLLLQERKYWTWEEFKNQRFINVLKYLGYDSNNILEEILEIHDCIDKEDKEIKLEHLLINYPKNSDVLFTAGYLNQISNKFHKAYHYYDQALSISPNALIYYNKGVMKMNQGDYDEAIIDFQNSLKLLPNYFESHLCLGKSHVLNEDIKNGIEIFKSLSDKYPEKPEPLLELINVFLSLEDIHRSQQILDLVRFRFSRSVDVGLNLSQIYMNFGYYDIALFNIEKWQESTQLNEKFSKLKIQIQNLMPTTNNQKKKINNLKDNSEYIEIRTNTSGIVSLYPNSLKHTKSPQGQINKISVKEVKTNTVSYLKYDSLTINYMVDGIPKTGHKKYCSKNEILISGDVIFEIGHENKSLPPTQEYIISENSLFRFVSYKVTHGERVKSGQLICELKKERDILKGEEFTKVKSTTNGLISIHLNSFDVDFGVFDNDPVIAIVEKSKENTILTKGDIVNKSTVIAFELGYGIIEVEAEITNGFFTFEEYTVKHGDYLQYKQPICLLKKMNSSKVETWIKSNNYIEIKSTHFALISLYKNSMGDSQARYALTDHDYVDCEDLMNNSNEVLIYKNLYCKKGDILKEGDILFKLCAMSTPFEFELDLQGEYKFITYLINHGDHIEYDDTVCLIEKI